MPHTWLFLTAPTLVVAVALLVKVALSLVRTTRQAVVARVPLLAEQRLVFDHPGALALSVEGPRFSRGFAGLSFTLTAEATGRPLAVAPVLLRTVVSSFDRVRVELLRFQVPHPGSYLLRVQGLTPGGEANRVVFSRPFGLALVAHVLGLVFLGALTVGSLVISGLVLAGR